MFTRHATPLRSMYLCACNPCFDRVVRNVLLGTVSKWQPAQQQALRKYGIHPPRTTTDISDTQCPLVKQILSICWKQGAKNSIGKACKCAISPHSKDGQLPIVR